MSLNQIYINPFTAVEILVIILCAAVGFSPTIERVKKSVSNIIIAVKASL